MSGSLIYHRQKIAKLTFRAFSPVSVHHHLEASFSKVSNLFGLISGAIIPFTSLQRRDSKPSNFAIHLVFLTLKKMWKDQLFNTSGISVWPLAFRARKVLGIFEKQATGNKLGMVHLSRTGHTLTSGILPSRTNLSMDVAAVSAKLDRSWSSVPRDSHTVLTLERYNKGYYMAGGTKFLFEC